MERTQAKLNNEIVRALPMAASGQYAKRDPALPGFMVVVGKRAKTFTLQVDVRDALTGKRRTVKESLGRFPDVNYSDARTRAQELLAGYRQRGRDPATNAGPGPTLAEAWERFLNGHLKRKGRAPTTIVQYTDCIERVLKEWLPVRLSYLSAHPELVARRHDAITRDHGPYSANHCMRAVRAIYRHARKAHRALPADNPVDAVDWNPEERRNRALSREQLGRWFEELNALENPLRREFHLLSLLSGSRPGQLLEARWEHWSVRKRLLHIPRPKGGPKRAYDIPLSREMRRCLVRAYLAGRAMYPVQAAEWVFPAASATGHIAEYKERKLSRVGQALRETYRTMAVSAGVPRLMSKILMNHKIEQDVHDGYVTVAALRSELLGAQESMSTALLAPRPG